MPPVCHSLFFCWCWWSKWSWKVKWWRCSSRKTQKYNTEPHLAVSWAFCSSLDSFLALTGVISWKCTVLLLIYLFSLFSLIYSFLFFSPNSFFLVYSFFPFFVLLFFLLISRSVFFFVFFFVVVPYLFLPFVFSLMLWICSLAVFLSPSLFIFFICVSPFFHYSFFLSFDSFFSFIFILTLFAQTSRLPSGSWLSFFIASSCVLTTRTLTYARHHMRTHSCKCACTSAREHARAHELTDTRPKVTLFLLFLVRRTWCTGTGHVISVQEEVTLFWWPSCGHCTSHRAPSSSPPFPPYLNFLSTSLAPPFCQGAIVPSVLCPHSGEIHELNFNC